MTWTKQSVGCSNWSTKVTYEEQVEVGLRFIIKQCPDLQR